MFRDEELIQKEYRRIEQAENQKQEEELYEKVLAKQRLQKTIQELFKEYESGKVEIDGFEYPTENRHYFDNKLKLVVFVDDIDTLQEQEQAISINYKQLQASVNLFYSREPFDQMSQKEFAHRIELQSRYQYNSYAPIENGTLQSNNKSIYYASAAIESAIGNLYIMNFHCVRKNDGVLGSFACRLRNRHPYENLFKAMIQHFYI